MQVCAVRDKKLKIAIAHQMIKTHVVVIFSRIAPRQLLAELEAFPPGIQSLISPDQETVS